MKNEDAAYKAFFTLKFCKIMHKVPTFMFIIGLSKRYQISLITHPFEKQATMSDLHIKIVA